jgi:hypothetical protein
MDAVEHRVPEAADDAVAFYAPLFGWTTAAPDERTRRLPPILLGDKPVAGMAPLMQEGPAAASTTYISTTGADDVA